MPQKEGNELERILAELNSNMKKEAEKDTAAHEAAAPSESLKSSEPAESAEPNRTEEPAAEKNEPKKKAAPRKNTRSGSKKKESVAQSLEEKLEQTAAAAADFVEEERRSFAETARIIEEDVGDREERSPAVRHIAVTAVVEVDDEEEKKDLPHRPIDPMPEDRAREERAPVVRKRRRKMGKREKSTAVLGLLVTFFVIIGLVSSIVTVVNLTKQLVNSTAKKEEFAQVIFPLVIVDVPEFESPTALDNSAIVSSAIWAFVIDDVDKSKYQKDDLGSLVLPDVDVEYYIRKLYGSEVPIQHQSVEDASISMVYDSEKKAYIVESTPKYLPYTPRVDKIVREGDLYTLTVSYILPDAMWNMNRGDRPYTVDKIMEYRLKKVDDNYQILSVKLLEVTGATTSDLTDGPTVGLESEEEPVSEPGGTDEAAGGESSDTTSEPASSAEETPSAAA